jgi:LPS-assembly lipoprotein
MRRLPALLLAAFLALLVAGCGWQLRGSGAVMPYKTMYIALPETADVRVWMQRYISTSGQTTLVDRAEDAEAVFQQLQDSRIKTILSVNAQGRVREYRLQLNYRFRLVDNKGRELVGPNEVALTRDITYDDSTVLAKDLEEGLLWRDMNNDLVNQIVRRLTIVKPKNPELDEDN